MSDTELTSERLEAPADPRAFGLVAVFMRAPFRSEFSLGAPARSPAGGVDAARCAVRGQTSR